MVKVATNGCYIFFGREPCKALFIDENSDRCYRGNQHIDPQVKFESIYEERFVQIALRYVFLAWLDPIMIPCQENATPLTLVLRLYYKSFGSPIVKLLTKGFGVLR